MAKALASQKINIPKSNQKPNIKKGGKLLGKMGKKIPIIGSVISFCLWPADVYSKGIVNGTLNTIADATPGVTYLKTGYEIATGEDIFPDIDSENTSINDENSADPEDDKMYPEDIQWMNEIEEKFTSGANYKTVMVE